MENTIKFVFLHTLNDSTMKHLLLLLLLCTATAVTAQNFDRRTERSLLAQTVFPTDSLANDPELLARLRNMPNIEVGRGITSARATTSSR